MGAATAMIFSPLFGWTFSSLSGSRAYFLVQLLDLMVFAPDQQRQGRADGAGAHRRRRASCCSSTPPAFGSLSIPLWLTGGPMGGVCAAILLPRAPSTA